VTSDSRILFVALCWAWVVLLSPSSVAQRSENQGPSAEAIRINRGLQVIVFQDRIRLQYDLGLNPVAASALFEG